MRVTTWLLANHAVLAVSPVFAPAGFVTSQWVAISFFQPSAK
ncbi:MAG: hypothetical protein FD143_3400, partial [Ignavibacteria bacterium]